MQKGVSKYFADGTKALANRDLHISDVEFMVLVGASGCGKSTALRLLVGLSGKPAYFLMTSRSIFFTLYCQ